MKGALRSRRKRSPAAMPELLHVAPVPRVSIVVLSKGVGGSVAIAEHRLSIVNVMQLSSGAGMDIAAISRATDQAGLCPLVKCQISEEG